MAKKSKELSTLSLEVIEKQIAELQAYRDKEIKKQAARESLGSELDAFLAERGINRDDLIEFLNEKPKRVYTPRGKTEWINPHDETQIYTGGRKPSWLKELMEASGESDYKKILVENK